LSNLLKVKKEQLLYRITEIDRGTLSEIIRQAGLKDEFLQLV